MGRAGRDGGAGTGSVEVVMGREGTVGSWGGGWKGDAVKGCKDRK